MFDHWLKFPAHYWLRATALVILIIGIAVSNVLMSIGAIWIISNWLIEAKFNYYGKRIVTTPELILILLFLVYSLVSICWSDDFWYAFHDIRIKLPLLAIPLALASGAPLDRKLFHALLYLFIGIVAFTSAFNFIRYNYFTVTADIRQMSWFISQIRFATLVNLALFACCYLLIEKKFRWFLAVPLMLWFTCYTFFAQVLNGYLLFMLLAAFTFFYFLKSMRRTSIKLALFSVVILLAVAGSIYIKQLIQTYHAPQKPDYSLFEHVTVNGNPYYHDTASTQTENGYYVWHYVAVEELRQAWNERSSIPYDSVDYKGQPMYGTLLRYMTSKNLRKDSAGVWSLSQSEIQKIEAGYTSVEMNSGLEAKLHAFLYEYDMYQAGGDPNGFSLLQRLEHLKTARHLLKTHWLWGVGIGDVDVVFQQAYQDLNSKLLPENRLRAHNQFISVWIALGIPGLIITLLWFVIPLLNKHKRDYFLGIVLISLTVAFGFEDMLETQAGATIFSLFYALAVFREREKN